MTRPDVVCVAHAADRTGPPLALLRLLRWARDHSPMRFEVALLAGGPLLDEFAAVAPTTVVGEPAQAHRSDLGHRARIAAGNLRLATMGRTLTRGRVLYVNTAWSARVLRYLPPGRTKVLTHVHELDLGLALLPRADRERLMRRSDHFLVGTPAVTRNLVERHGVDPGRVSEHPYFVDLGEEPPPPPRRPEGVPEDALLVGGGGIATWRKAPDLFVQLADRVAERFAQPVHFEWVGGPPGGPADLGVPADLIRLGLGEVVHFVGQQSDPLAWFGGLDLFALTSREDAFPLVCLESAALGVPVVTFENGGIPDFVRACDGGAVAPLGDVAALAAATSTLLADGPDRRAAGERAAERVRTHHHPSVGAASILDELGRWAA